jgi:hypothetical protein
MLYFYFYFISLSFIGYGIFICKVLKIKFYDFGISGLIGISFSALIAYQTSFFLQHGKLFNSIFFIIGLIFFLYNLKNLLDGKKELIKHFIIFGLILSIFISVGKNHDDFPYYHFPYIHLLTEYSHPIGLGNLNNGFRTPSSLFFISSLFYLPKINIYLYHILPAIILGFSNLFLFNLIISKKSFDNNKIINFLSLVVLIFINIFFYRLAEHGTDRSGMILLLLSIIILISIINDKIDENKNCSLTILFSIFIFFTISIKPYYIVYLSLFTIFLFYDHTRKIFLKLFFTKSSIYCLLFLIYLIFYTFINSGCLIFPIKETCIENISWAIDKTSVESVNIWFELWSKAGATPTFVVEDREEYIKSFNWLSNWIENYFFNKVSDFLGGILLLSTIIFFTFKNRKILEKKNKESFYILYLLLLIILLEWFLKHPALRYGGYHLIAILVFLPLTQYLANYSYHDFNNFKKKSIILILITITIFFSRNIIRLNKEYTQYNYNPFKVSNFQFIGGDEKFHLRYSNHMKKYKKNYKYFKFLGKKILIIK